MGRKLHIQNQQYVFIQKIETGLLLHGCAKGVGKNSMPLPSWKHPSQHKLAMRFTSVENAIRYAREHYLTNYFVIDQAGNALYTDTETIEERRNA